MPFDFDDDFDDLDGDPVIIIFGGSRRNRRKSIKILIMPPIVFFGKNLNANAYY